jgi:ribonuclease D
MQADSNDNAEQSPSVLPSFTYVDTPAGLPAAVEAVREAPRVALDIEANGLYSYFHRVCLIQFSTAEANFILDPFADMDLTPLLEALTDT